VKIGEFVQLKRWLCYSCSQMCCEDENSPRDQIRDSSVGIATRLRAGRSGFLGFISCGGWTFFSAPPRPLRLWGPPSLQSNGYRRLTIHLHLVPKSRMRGAIPPLPLYVFMAWCFTSPRDQKRKADLFRVERLFTTPVRYVRSTSMKDLPLHRTMSIRGCI
jgi:hypothetical protein